MARVFDPLYKTKSVRRFFYIQHAIDLRRVSERHSAVTEQFDHVLVAYLLSHLFHRGGAELARQVYLHRIEHTEGLPLPLFVSALPAT